MDLQHDDFPKSYGSVSDKHKKRFDYNISVVVTIL